MASAIKINPLEGQKLFEEMKKKLGLRKGPVVIFDDTIPPKPRPVRTDYHRYRDAGLARTGHSY